MAPTKKTTPNRPAGSQQSATAGNTRGNLARTSLAHQAYDYLKERLLEGQYAAGERLHIEKISKELKFSRFPVLEALKQLEAEQFVVITPQVGCAVVDASEREISDHFRFMERAEGFIAELAAERGSTQDMDNLGFISSQIGLLLLSGMPTPQIVKLYRRLNRDFHGAIHQMAAAPELTAKIAKFFDRNDFYIAMVGGGQIFARILAESHREHQTIVAAIAARDLAGARAVIEVHIQKIHDRVLSSDVTKS